MLALILGLMTAAFTLGYFLQPEHPNPMVSGRGLPTGSEIAEQKNLQEMLAFCATDSYLTTDVECIQTFLKMKGDLTESPDVYDVWCGGQSIGYYACF